MVRSPDVQGDDQRGRGSGLDVLLCQTKHTAFVPRHNENEWHDTCVEPNGRSGEVHQLVSA
jgi:hypothetical protein